MEKTLFFNTLKAPAARAHQYLKSETKRLEKILDETPMDKKTSKLNHFRKKAPYKK